MLHTENWVHRTRPQYDDDDEQRIADEAGRRHREGAARYAIVSYTGGDWYDGSTWQYDLLAPMGQDYTWPSAAEAEAAYPGVLAAFRLARPGRHDPVVRQVWDRVALDGMVAAMRTAVTSARRAALHRYRTVAATVETHIRSEYPELMRWRYAPEDLETIGQCDTAARDAIRVAAARISQAYGLGLGSDWAERHFGGGGDERAALAGHIGRTRAWSLPPVVL